MISASSRAIVQLTDIDVSPVDLCVVQLRTVKCNSWSEGNIIRGLRGSAMLFRSEECMSNGVHFERRME